MPLYEYRCTSCDAKFEILRPFSRADEPTPCPVCHNGARRQISSFASFSKSSSGEVSSVGTKSGCSSCASHNCGSCH